MQDKLDWITLRRKLNGGKKQITGYKGCVESTRLFWLVFRWGECWRVDVNGNWGGRDYRYVMFNSPKKAREFCQKEFEKDLCSRNSK